MKKNLSVLLLAILCVIACVFAIVGCDNQTPVSNGNTIQTPNKNEGEISVGVYIDGNRSDTVYADKNGKLIPPTKPEDITVNPNSEKYFNGWFIDSTLQTPLTNSVVFDGTQNIYGKWIDVYTSRYQYSVNEGAATVTGYTDSNATVLVVPAYINGFPVKSIGSNAFTNRTLLRTVVVCNGVKIISGFRGCNSMTSISVPDSVTEIETLAFQNCSSLENINIPSSVTKIGSGAFGGCQKLNNITLESENAHYSLIDNCLIENESKTLIAVCNCDAITIPSDGSVTRIEQYAVCNGNSVTSITVPNSVTYINVNSFYGCWKLTSITLPFVGTNKEGTPRSGEFGSIFGHKVEDPLPGSPRYYAPQALKNVVITSGATIGGFLECRNIESITLPHGVKNINRQAFAGCSKLKSINIPNSVESIGDDAFFNCALENITIPNSVTSIGSSAFYGCRRLKNITIPKNVTSIGSAAFAGSGLTSAVFENTSGWKIYNYQVGSREISSSDLANPATAAKYLCSTYPSWSWTRM